MSKPPIILALLGLWELSTSHIPMNYRPNLFLAPQTPHPNVLTPISQIQHMEVWGSLTCDPGVPSRNTASQCKGNPMHLTRSSWCCYCSAGPTQCSSYETVLYSLHRQPGRCHWIINLAVQAVDGHEGRLSWSKFKQNYIHVKNENETNLNLSPSVET